MSFPACPFQSRITKKFVFNWNFRFSKLYLESEITKNITILDLTKEMSIDLDYNSELIFSIQKYWAYLTQNIFNKFIEDKKCFINTVDYQSENMPKYFTLYCDYQHKDEIKKNFRNIKFECQECNYTFVLTFDDVMKSIKVINSEEKEENKLLFLIVYDDNTNSIENYHRWIMGKPFLQKYQFFFEQNNKMIYFYRKENNIYSDVNTDTDINDNTKSTLNNSFSKIIIIVALLICLNFLIIFVLYKAIKMIKSKRKEKTKNEQFVNDDYKELIDK